jgi:hypothetical protein
MEYTISNKLKDVVELLSESPRGGFATVHGYVQDGHTMVQKRVTNKNIITRFSVEKLYMKRLSKLALLEPTSKDDVELFKKAKGELIASLNKTLSGIRDDAQRKAHDKFYVKFSHGVVGHLATERIGKDTVLLKDTKGLPYVDSIMLNALEISSTIIEEGEYKTVNSRPLTLMKKAIEKRLPKTMNMKRLSLKEGKFESLKIGGMQFDKELEEVIE